MLRAHTEAVNLTRGCPCASSIRRTYFAVRWCRRHPRDVVRAGRLARTGARSSPAIRSRGRRSANGSPRR
jgi:hypothetical protein